MAGVASGDVLMVSASMLLMLLAEVSGNSLLVTLPALGTLAPPRSLMVFLSVGWFSLHSETSRRRNKKPISGDPRLLGNAYQSMACQTGATRDGGGSQE